MTALTREQAWLSGLRDAIPLFGGYIPVAISFGLVATQAGFSFWQTVMVSTLIYAGASQFLLVAMVASGAPLWMRRHLQRRHLARGPQRMPANEAEGASEATEPTEAAASIPGWLSILAPLMIAAMFGVSLVPAAIDSGSAWLASISGVVATLLTWRRTRSLGWPVFTGVLVYGLVVVLDGVMF